MLKKLFSYFSFVVVVMAILTLIVTPFLNKYQEDKLHSLPKEVYTVGEKDLGLGIIADKVCSNYPRNDVIEYIQELNDLGEYSYIHKGQPLVVPTDLSAAEFSKL